MEFNNFINTDWSPAKAYILGLLYPRIDLGSVNNKNVVLGKMVRNSNSINDNDLIVHLIRLLDFLMINNYSQDILYHNSSISNYNKSFDKTKKESKHGIIIALEFSPQTKVYSDQIKIIDKKLKILCESLPDKYAKYFNAALFDGRSSYDKSRSLIAIDIDKHDKEKYSILKKIAEICKLEVLSLNNREKHIRVDPNKKMKANQFRYSKKSVNLFLSQENAFPILSVSRINEIKNHKKDLFYA